MKTMMNGRQWRIQGRGRPLVLDQTNAQRAKKTFFLETGPPAPLSKGLDDSVHKLCSIGVFYKQVFMRICLFSTFYWVTYLRFVLISSFYMSECVLEKV